MNAIYLRVSTDEQSASGLGLAAQRAACEARAAALGLSLLSVFTDEGISGSVPVAERAGLVAALDAVGRGGVLLVAKRDRLARDYMAAGWVDLECARRGARVVSAAGEGTDSDDPMARVMRGIVDLFAQYERDMIRARTKSALAAKRAKNEAVNGTVPFGFRIVCTEMRADGRARVILAPCPHEQGAIARIHALRIQGLGLRAIASTLSAEGVRGRGCSAIAHTTVQRILRQDRTSASAV